MDSRQSYLIQYTQYIGMLRTQATSHGDFYYGDSTSAQKRIELRVHPSWLPCLLPHPWTKLLQQGEERQGTKERDQSLGGEAPCPPRP